jgi:hypothetical protein
VGRGLRRRYINDEETTKQLSSLNNQKHGNRNGNERGRA